MEQIEERYYNSTKIYPRLKERYGTVVYEDIPSWVRSHKDLMLLCTIVKDATKEYPDFAAELVDDLIPQLPEMSYHLGYFEAVLYLKTGTEWGNL